MLNSFAEPQFHINKVQRDETKVMKPHEGNENEAFGLPYAFLRNPAFVK